MTNYNMIRGWIFASILGLTSMATAAPKAQDLLVKFAPGMTERMQLLAETLSTAGEGSKAEVLTDTWMHLQVSGPRVTTTLEALKNESAVEFVQPNYKIKLLENYQIQDPLRRAALTRALARAKKNQTTPTPAPAAKPDNPAIPNAPAQATGADPDFGKQWGMIDIGVKDAWKKGMGTPEMIVAVIDTGVDYTHEDLLPNMWRNPKEIPNNGIDDDHNGFVDDVIGWDFVSNDNKPFDLAVDPSQLLAGGGNPGHGTHCAGNVAARANNAKGIAGVAPNVKIMALRFISDKGEGTTADAIKAIKYAVDNGAKVLSNSWGSEGEDPADGQSNQALRDTIQYAQDHGVLFIAAAGNGHNGVGYDNDKDAAPAYPASYDHDAIISVAAIDKKDNLGDFSNWGAKSVDIGAPGVAIYSTTVGNHYSDTVIDMGGFQVTWDGTSMATPHVAGAAALYWSAHPEKNWKEVKAALLGSAQKIRSLSGKVVSDGKLDVKALMNMN